MRAPDILSWSRIALIIPISVLAYFRISGLFVLLYLLAVLTDFLDGFVARKLNISSANGAVLDGTADTLFGFFSVLWLNWFAAGVIDKYLPFIIIASFFVIGFMILSLVKIRKILMPHLWSAKAASLLLFLLIPTEVLLGDIPLFTHLTWVMIVISRIKTSTLLFNGN